MYKNFFGLNRNPFELSPDPYFIFPTERSKEALASVYYAVCRRKGFIVMTGEVGTGKTLIVRCLLALLKRQQVAFANVFNPRLSVIEFLRYIVYDLGIEVAEPSKGNLLRALYGFLLSQFEKGLTTVLVIDEAQQLSSAVLEEIRLLTNLETSQQKLLQIVLVGQPEVDEKLDSFELRQLKQRIAVRCRLQPLREHETRDYIAHRLQLAGRKSPLEEIFSVDALEAIYRYSLGIPRIVNSLCEQALVAAYSRGEQIVRVEMIDEVASYLRLQPAPDLVQSGHRSPIPDRKSAARSVLDLIDHLERIANRGPMNEPQLFRRS